MRPLASLSRRRRIVLGALVVLVALLGWFVWPTQYRYLRFQRNRSGALLRENRFTGRLEILMPGVGWKYIGKRKER
jgi:hypothetical protein